MSGGGFDKLMEDGAKKLRQMIAFVLLHQFATGGGQSSGGANAQADEQQNPEPRRASVLANNNLLSVAALANGWRSTLDFSEDLIAVKIPMVLLFLLVLGFFAMLAYVVVSFMDALLRRFDARRNIRALFTFLLIGVLGFLAIYVAFASIGIDFGNLFLAIGLLTIAISAAFTTIFANIGAGLLIQLADKVEFGQVISVNGTTGVVILMNLSDVTVEAVTGTGVIESIPNSWFFQYVVTRRIDLEMQIEQVRQSGATAGVRPGMERLNAFALQQQSASSSADDTESGSKSKLT